VIVDTLELGDGAHGFGLAPIADDVHLQQSAQSSDPEDILLDNVELAMLSYKNKMWLYLHWLLDAIEEDADRGVLAS